MLRLYEENRGFLKVVKLTRNFGQVNALMAANPGADYLEQTGTDAINAIEAWDHQVIQPLHQTLEDEDAWETMLAGQVRFVLDVIDRTGAPVTGGSLERLADLKAQAAVLAEEKARILEELIGPINRWARENQVPHIAL